jgi:hypothetical protein
MLTKVALHDSADRWAVERARSLSWRGTQVAS